MNDLEQMCDKTGFIERLESKFKFECRINNNKNDLVN